MNPLLLIARWLDVRPNEYRTFTLSALGAFLVISFVVVARALREAFFLDEFDIELLPYMAILTTIVSLPSVGAFSQLLVRADPSRVYRNLLLGLGAGLLLLWAATERADSDTAIQITTGAFYLWTAAGSLLLTSGFWVLTSEYFVLRDAKRLFGIIGGAGTLGAMIAGLSLSVLSEALGNRPMVLGLIATLGVLYGLQFLWPGTPIAHAESTRGTTSIREGIDLLLKDRHLRTLALIVAVATAASFMIDYQFKEAASLYYETDEELVGFFGMFYGLTGVVSLALQVFLASRMLATVGVRSTLSVLPIALLIGSTWLLLAPTLIAATLIRGVDNSVRKSLHRSVIEYLYVPVPSLVRRKTKTLIDSFVDSSAEGAAALLVLLWVSGFGLSSRGLNLVIIALALGFLALNRAMGSQYLQTLLQRLKEGQEDLGEDLARPHLVTGEMTMTMTQLDMQTLLTQTGLIDTLPSVQGAQPRRRATPKIQEPQSLLEQISAPDPVVVSAALDETAEWDVSHVPALLRLLARDAFYRRAARILARLGTEAVASLAEILNDESADFVVRRRTPRVLAEIDATAADDALVASLSARRFEVRYRGAVALARRRRKGLSSRPDGSQQLIWDAVRAEVHRERPIWELQRLLDERPTRDDFINDRVYGRGELSLEHTFRLLSLVLEAAPIRTAFHGIVLDDERLKSISLEYLDQVLPADVRDRLWPFIGDISEFQRQREIRAMDEVVDDLLKTGATLFVGEAERAKLREALDNNDDD